MQNQDTTLSKVDQRALDILLAGKVHYTIGQKFALVEGSRGEVYTVTRDHCECPAFRRYPGSCKHQRALQALCGLIRIARAEARETGRTRLPWVVGLALRPVVKEEAIAASVLTCRHGEPAGCPVCRSEAWAREDRETCLKCGSPLTPDGRCPAQDARLRDLDALLFGTAA